MNLNKKINWIFFDVGGVLVDESAPTLWRQKTEAKVLQEIGRDISLEDIQKIWPQVSGMIGSLDLNVFKLFLKNENLTNQAFEKFKEIRSHRAPYVEMITVRQEALPALSELSKKYKLGLIANQAPAIRTKLETVGFSKFFDHNTVSHEYGYEKPDSRLFETVFKETGADPLHSVMIDDNIERGLVPAKNFGMVTIWYKYEARADIPENTVDFTISSFEDLTKLF